MGVLDTDTRQPINPPEAASHPSLAAYGSQRFCQGEIQTTFDRWLLSNAGSSEWFNACDDLLHCTSRSAMLFTSVHGEGLDHAIVAGDILVRLPHAKPCHVVDKITGDFVTLVLNGQDSSVATGHEGGLPKLQKVTIEQLISESPDKPPHMKSSGFGIMHSLSADDDFFDAQNGEQDERIPRRVKVLAQSKLQSLPAPEGRGFEVFCKTRIRMTKKYYPRCDCCGNKEAGMDVYLDCDTNTIANREDREDPDLQILDTCIARYRKIAKTHGDSRSSQVFRARHIANGKYKFLTEPGNEEQGLASWACAEFRREYQEWKATYQAKRVIL